MGLLTGNLNVPGILYLKYIEDIIRWREDMNFIFEWQTIFYERAQRVSKILFLPRENDRETKRHR